MVEIIWGADIQPGNKAEIEKFLMPFLWLVPTWCHYLRITLEIESANNKDSAAGTIIRYEYRRAHISIYAGWLTETDESKALHIIHELLHVANSIYIDFTDEMINRFAPADGDTKILRGFLYEESRILCESVTQDLAKAIYDKFLSETANRDHTNDIENALKEKTE